MNEIPAATDSPAPAVGSTAQAVGTTRSKLAALAEMSIAACGGNACVVTWRGGWGDGLLCAPASSRWRAAFGATLAAMDRQLEASRAPGCSLHLNSAQLVQLLAGAVPNDQRFDAVAKSAADGPNRVMVMLIAPHGRAMAELEAIGSLAADNALALIRADNDSNRRDFWRRRAVKTAERLAKAKLDLGEAATQGRGLDHALSSALRLRGRNRFAGLGSIFARMGRFDAWIVAALEDEELRPAAASAALAPIPPLDKNSAIAESLRRNSTIRRTTGALRAPGYHEDRLFARFSSYLCVPFESGAVALAARQEIEPASVERVEAFAARLAPVARTWIAEARADRLSRLVRSLGLRMFGAIDAERARIARDLHDDQAQLLAAARIAIVAGPDEARSVFKQLEDALRLRVRELRPATLGRSTLENALRYELRRLADGGIKGRLIHPGGMNALTRPVQQLCYQVVREALSNVIRHADATLVEIGVEKRGGQVRLSIFDNGKGMSDSGGRNGLGLGGLGERLDLMGGKLRIESRAGSTRLIAEIPEPA